MKSNAKKVEADPLEGFFYTPPGPTVNVSVRLPRSKRKAIYQICLERKITIEQYTTEAVRERLERIADE